MKDQERKERMKKVARELGERIAKEMRENDPEKEKAYEEEAAKREAETVKELAAIMAKRKK
jgi:hypothetical protein